MIQAKQLFLIFLFLCLVSPLISYENSDYSNGKDTLMPRLTKDENSLFKKINDLRLQNNRSILALSPNLCKVAQTHIADLIKYKPQAKGCNLHSWSKGGKWTSCCNTNEDFGLECMKSKPREITSYKGDGYELIYWSENKATAADAFSLWNEVDASLDMILTRGKWNGFEWKAMGIGIKDGYAILWLGDSINPAPVTKPATIPPTQSKEVAKSKTEVNPKESIVKPEVKPQKANGTGKFYVIVGSFSNAEAARAAMVKIREKGYSEPILLEGESQYRIAMAVFDTKEKADQKKNQIQGIFPGTWVLKK
jgi:hypothetical protein